MTSPEPEQRERVADLEARIAELESLDDRTLGAFTAWDWLLCTLGALVLPALALWWCA